MGVHCRMDPITDGNPISWTIRILGQKLPKMLDRAGYEKIAAGNRPRQSAERAARPRGLRARDILDQA